MNNEEKNIQAEQPEEVKKPTIADWWKKLATGAKAGIIAALSLIVIVPIVLVIALAGNGDNGGNADGGNGDKTIEVTVVDTDGNPVEGVEVQFIAASMPLPKKLKTDANGKVIPADEGAVKVKIIRVPSGYSDSQEGVEYNIPDDGKLTITVEKIAPFIVRVVDQDENPVVGALIQVCKSGGDAADCVPLGATDENGVATRDGSEGDYEAKILSLPEGYEVDDISKYYSLVGNEVTIVVTKTAE